MKNKFQVVFESGKVLTVELNGARISGIEVSREVDGKTDKAIEIRRQQ